MLSSRTTTIVACLALLTVAPVRADEPAPATVEFNRDVRPILSDTCFLCHGPDKGKRKAGLRLDTEEGAFADLGGHFALVARRPEQSAVYQRIIDTDAKRRMPPASAGRQLTARDIAVLRRWIEQGARWQPHWAFLPPRATPPPTVRNATARNPIDNFVRARLEKGW